MRRALLFFAAVVACTGADVDSFVGKWSGEARLWQGSAKPERIRLEFEIKPGGLVDGHIGGARCLEGHLANRTWWQIRSFNRYEMRIDCTLAGELTAGVVREHGTVALIPGALEFRGWFFSEGHNGFPLLAKPTQVRADRLFLRRKEAGTPQSGEASRYN